MILYRLRCAKGHEFDSWFKDSKTYERQEKKSLIGCAVCGSAKVERALMAPRIGKNGKDAALPAPVEAPAAEAVALGGEARVVDVEVDFRLEEAALADEQVGAARVRHQGLRPARIPRVQHHTSVEGEPEAE